MDLLITGVTRTGNLGGAAMLCAVEDVLCGRVDDLALASILPRRDRSQDGPDHARIVNSDYRYLLLVGAPLCLVLWPVRRWRWLRQVIAQLPLFGDINRCDAIADISGIAFVDGRGLALLYYNAAIVLPALFFDKPVHKLSQALGPFERPINSGVARWILRRCASVAARGEISLQHLERLGVKTAIHRPDVSFALNISSETSALACRKIEDRFPGNNDTPLVLCSPSAVVKAHCAAAEVDMISVFTEVLIQLRESGVRVALLPHSADTGIRKNDDETVALEIRDAAAARMVEIPILDPRGDPRMARALIGCSSVFLASRFHSMIAALSQAVPVVTVGWSHKYAEAAAPFGMARFTIDYALLTPETLLAKISDVLSCRVELAGAMRSAADKAKQLSIDGIRVVFDGAKV